MGWGRTLEDAHGGGEVVDAARGPQRRLDHLLGRHQVVRERVVQIPLFLPKCFCVSPYFTIPRNMSSAHPSGGLGASVERRPGRRRGRRTCSSNTSLTISNSCSNLRRVSRAAHHALPPPPQWQAQSPTDALRASTQARRAGRGSVCKGPGIPLRELVKGLLLVRAAAAAHRARAEAAPRHAGPAPGRRARECSGRGARAGGGEGAEAGGAAGGAAEEQGGHGGPAKDRWRGKGEGGRVVGREGSCEEVRRWSKRFRSRCCRRGAWRLSQRRRVVGTWS